MAKRRLVVDKTAQVVTGLDVPAEPAAVVEDRKPDPVQVQAGFRRFAINVGVSLSHDQRIYTASPEGWVDLPSGEDWYLPLIPAGVIKEQSNDSQTD